MTTPRREAASTDHGFTVVELAITMAIAMLVMSSILGVLVSQSNAERRVSTFADNQEVLRQAIVLLQRDIRSAEPLEQLLLPDGNPAPRSHYALRIRLNVYEDISQPAVPIQWVVDTTTKELRRELVDASGAPTAVTYRVRGVANSYALDNELFRFFDATNEEFALHEGSAADIAHCTVRIQVNLRAAPGDGPAPFLLTSDAQLRNRLPGGIGCTAS